MPFVIRPLSKRDMQACASIIVDAFKEQGLKWTMQRATECVKDFYSKEPKLCFCLELEGKVVGVMLCSSFVFVLGKYLFIGEFAVSPAQQGKGFGTKALEFLEGFARKKGFAAIWLETDIKEKAFRLYQKSGFKISPFVCLEKVLK